MARSGFFAGFVTTLLGSGLAATLHDSNSKIVRREEKSVHVASVGQMVESISVEANMPPCADCEKYDYVLGVPNSNDCRDKGLDHLGNTRETLVTAADMCKWAASESDAWTDTLPSFTLDDQDEYVTHPYGCFNKKCHPNGDDTKPERDCFFRNPGEETLSDPTATGFAGTPICKRLKFTEGATGAQGGCPDEFKVIDTPEACRETCKADNFQCADNFEIGVHNYTRHHDFPKGCFHSLFNTTNAIDTVYWNPESEGTTVEGTVLCEPSSPLKFPIAGAQQSLPTGDENDGA
jgi:hypothetical protein